MITVKPLEQSAERRLLHRSFHEHDGSIRMLSSDGRSAARLTSPQWETLIDDFAAAMQPVNKALRWGFNLTVPIIILTFAFMPSSRSIPVIGALHGKISLIIPILMVVWWPMLMLVAHALFVKRLNRQFDMRLAAMPAAPVPTGRPVAFQTMEVAALVLVGPGLAIALVGSLFPHFFDGTPLMGSSLGIFGSIGLLLFLVLAGRRLWPTMLAWRENRVEAAEPDAPAPPRRSDPLARARNAES